jgi:hypothetical protein
MEVYEKLIYENMEKGYQYRLTVSEFREQEYLHIRKYFLSYEGEWVATKEGAAIPATIQNTYAILDGLLELCSQAEGNEAIVAHLQTKISDLQNQSKDTTIES